MISEILLARFLSHDLRSFLSIRSMGLGTTTSLIIYLQPWSESMALAPSIWQIFPIPLNLDYLSSSKLGREICGFEKKTLWELVSCVEVILVSKFHPIWYLITQESKLRRKFLGGPDIYPFFWICPPETGHIRSKDPLNNFCNNIWWLLWS
jgi:hypothetical protein